jgi:ankyrin repeat protein
MTRVTRELTPQTSLDSLRKMAKRWRQDIEAGDAPALARFRDVFPASDGKPKLREVQHALAHEFSFASWAALKEEIEDRARSYGELLEQFLRKAVHRYGDDARDGPQRNATAARLLARHPEIAGDGIHTAVLVDDVEAVRGFLAKDKALANDRHAFDGWTPLMRLAYSRLPLPDGPSNALAIATLLIDAGADVNAHLPGGLKGFTVLTGVIGDGEASQSAHPQAEAFARLLIARGADPVDGQALYNTSLGPGDTFWLDLLWEASKQRGDDMAVRWHTEIPDTLGPPLEYLLGNAVPGHPRRVAWLLDHGADPNASNFYSHQAVIRHAAMAGRQEIVDLLVKHGAKLIELTDADRFFAAIAQGDIETIRRIATTYPAFLKAFAAMSSAIKAHNLEVAKALLDLGMSPDIGDDKNFRALHLTTHAGAAEIARLLIARGAEIDPFEQRYGGAPLSHANYQQRPEMIAVIAPHSRNIRGLCFAGCVDRLRELFTETPALVNQPIHDHEPPVFCLPDDEDSAVELAELLVSLGADLSVKNADGLTPAQAARKRGLEDAAALLET